MASIRLAVSETIEFKNSSYSPLILLKNVLIDHLKNFLITLVTVSEKKHFKNVCLKGPMLQVPVI